MPGISKPASSTHQHVESSSLSHCIFSKPPFLLHLGVLIVDTPRALARRCAATLTFSQPIDNKKKIHIFATNINFYLSISGLVFLGKSTNDGIHCYVNHT